MPRFGDSLTRLRVAPDALDFIPVGIAQFDSNDRYVSWNRKYAEVYCESKNTIVVGGRFEDTLRSALADGQFPDAVGREESWLAERLARRALRENLEEQHLSGDRWFRIEERRTADGGSISVHIDITDIKQREESSRLLFEDNPVPMWVFDRETLKFLAVNDAAVSAYGYSQEQFMAMSILDIRLAEDHRSLKEQIRCSETWREARKVWRHVRADGGEIDVDVCSRRLAYRGRNASLVAAVDVTEQQSAAEKVREAREFLETIIDQIPASITVKGASDRRYILINKSIEDAWARPRDQVVGRTADELFPTAAAEMVQQLDDIVVANPGRVHAEEVMIAPHGQDTRVVAMRRLAIAGPSGTPRYLLSISDDVTEKKQAEQRAEYLASHDSLTQLSNRRAFNEKLATTLEQAGTSGEEFAVLCLDVDRFKEVNDVFGHGCGDALLKEIARKLQEVSDGAFVARMGGDEFTIIAKGHSQPLCTEALAERILDAFAVDLNIEGQSLRVGLSIGVALYPGNGTDAGTLVANADAALYRAKAGGRGAVRFFEIGMDQRLRERRLLQHDLRAAIERDELILHYQPQASVDGNITGFEVLVRWNHPTRGRILPTMFIPLAEESGLIIPMGERILREACREAASWPTPLNIAVNLSPVQFQHGDLVKLVHEILLQTGLPSKRLELEITESVLIDDFDRTISILRRLKDLGVKIAMDDFGTGYSSLSYLQAFPFDKIKIDREFISNIDRSPQSAAIIRAVIGIGHGLSLPIVAEGVETKEQLAFLSKESCDQIQGYYLGRPRPIRDYNAIVGRAALPGNILGRAADAI
jgi:diguanylate cyclase (GGDEF)-like protein/PAS domain S-box-containing protein